MPEASIRSRLTGLAVGVMFIGYGIYGVNLLSGIVLVPVGAFVIALVVLFMLYQAFREQWQRRSIRPSSPGTLGNRQCLSCGQTYVAYPGPCPVCKGTLASIAPVSPRD